MKQETIEEEAENSALKHFLFPKELFFKMCKCSQNYSLLEEEFGLDNTTKYREILGFIKGAKLQAERMYNGNDVFKELAEWLLINKRSVFMDADISKESKKKIMNDLGYSSNSLDG